ncbi:MAG: ATP-binding cassette domain-containing protein [Clostridiales bacterium]|jgi:ABC-2 type transport system ATP-binding protein|nr:ATP-binding cassette domain-containing protein [Clostridiales bacterium]
MDEIIKLSNLTKDYGGGRGIFDITLSVRKGETFGFVGTNGSGKTTTIREIMGFLKPDGGAAEVLGMNAWTDSPEIKRSVGYIPGEIAFPDVKTGTAFLKIQAEFLGLTDMTYANYLIKKLQLDPSASLKRMSKGMKQKTAMVAALMGDKEILILDEPTTGLDPLMRSAFMELITEEKRKGRTIFMSSHLFEEIEDTCDRVALIKDGKLLDIADMEKIRYHNIKTYKIEFNNAADYKEFCGGGFDTVRRQDGHNQATVEIDDKNVNALFKALKSLDVKFISEKRYDLEQYFNKFYIKGEQK